MEEWRFVWSENISTLTQAGGVSALFITEKPFIIHDTETIITETYLQLNIIDPVVFSCVSKVQLHQHESFTWLQQENILPKKGKIKSSSSVTSPCKPPRSRLKRFVCWPLTSLHVMSIKELKLIQLVFYR